MQNLRVIFVLLCLFFVGTILISCNQFRSVSSSNHIQYYPITNAEMAQTEDGRQFLKYLVNCALSEGVVVYANVNGQRFEFQGAMGLAPEWINRPLTEKEQRWVSAAMLCRINYFGIKVQISMRAKHSPYASLQTSQKEEEQFTIYEGDFFGNLFAEIPVAGVCLGKRTPEQNNDPILKKRVGTQEIGVFNGNKISSTNFIITGNCDSPNAHTLNGEIYNEYISVYLKPEPLAQ